MTDHELRPSRSRAIEHLRRVDADVTPACPSEDAGNLRDAPAVQDEQHVQAGVGTEYLHAVAEMLGDRRRCAAKCPWAMKSARTCWPNVGEPRSAARFAIVNNRTRAGGITT